MKKEDYVYQVFERVAPGYDAANTRISLGQQNRWKRGAARLMLRHVPAGGAVLDLCCGTGDMSRILLALREDLHITGLDFSPAMLAVARERFAGDARVELREGNAMALPFPDAVFDGAMISFGLRNTADFAQVLREMRRVCKDGAPVCVVDSFVPQAALVRPFYRLYFSHLMPLLGGGRRHAADYRWLNQSTEQFLRVDALARLMEQSGMEPCSRSRYMFGSCAAVCALKKETK